MNDSKKYGSIETAPLVIGAPGVDGKSPFVQQGYEDTCAIRCQELILRDFGVNVSEDVLRDQAFQCGWYQPGGGTKMQDVGNLLEMYGVEVNRYEGANIFNLTEELAQGHKVIIGVDSGELWDKGLLEGLEDRFGLSGADHALIVSGIDTSDPDNVQVILTDPGSGDVAKAYPIDQFVDAWKDSNCFMVTTADVAPQWLPEMSNFDYELGHLDSIGQMSWNDFEHCSSSLGNVQDEDTFTELVTSFADAVQGRSPVGVLLAGIEELMGNESSPEASILEDSDVPDESYALDDSDAPDDSSDVLDDPYTLNEDSSDQNPYDTDSLDDEDLFDDD